MNWNVYNKYSLTQIIHEFNFHSFIETRTLHANTFGNSVTKMCHVTLSGKIESITLE